MFDTLTRRLSATFAKLTGRTRITADMLDDALAEIRVALLEADVALTVVKKIMADVRQAAVGQKIIENIRPAEQIAKIVYDELAGILGAKETRPAAFSSLPSVAMLVGLQGTGKTTTAGKLALHLKNQGRRVLLASADVYRPSAREQLEILAAQAGVESLPIIAGETPAEIARRAVAAFSVLGAQNSALVFDTAGRLQIDGPLMAELQELKEILSPTDILLAADAMAGQESLNVAREFNSRLGITGLVMTRADGDARGGAVLSMRAETGAPVLFAGTGEKIGDLEPFHPDRAASRILGMGDVVSLVEKAQEHISERDAESMMAKMIGGEFNLDDMLKQIKQIKKMGSIGGLLKLVPGMSQIAGALRERATDSAIDRQMAIIQSMTPAERARPDIIFAARKNRIAAGAGASVRDVEQLLKNFDRMRAQMKMLSAHAGPGQLMEMIKQGAN
jgi:signal recognition particle subunit SRP54